MNIINPEALNPSARANLSELSKDSIKLGENKMYLRRRNNSEIVKKTAKIIDFPYGDFECPKRLCASIAAKKSAKKAITKIIRESKVDIL